MFASSQHDGSLPVSKDLVKIICNIPEIWSRSSRSIVGLILSGPAALFGWSALSNLLIPSVPMVKLGMVGYLLV